VRVRVKVRIERDIVSKVGVCLVVFLISYGLWFAGWLGLACLEGTSCLGVSSKVHFLAVSNVLAVYSLYRQSLRA